MKSLCAAVLLCVLTGTSTVDARGGVYEPSSEMRHSVADIQEHERDPLVCRCGKRAPLNEGAAAR